MESVYVLICLGMAALGIKTEKKIFNPVTVMCGLWGVIIGLSSLHLYRLYIPDIKTYNCIMLGIAMFFAGYYFLRITLGGKIVVLKKSSENKIRYNYELNYKLMYAILLFCIPFLAKDFFVIVTRLGFGSDLHEIQKLLQQNENVFTRSSIESFLRVFIVNPVIWIFVPITVVDFWVGKRDKLLIVLSSIIILLKVFSTGGRASFIQFAFFFVCVFFLANNNKSKTITTRFKNRSKRDKFVFVGVGALVVVVLVMLTFSRAGQNAIKTIYYDFAMQPIMLKKWTKIASTSRPGMGVASLNGFLTPIDYVLRNTVHLSLPDLYQTTYKMIMDTDTEWQWIGNGVSANAYVSAFWFFYVDGRLLGVALGSFIYGAFNRAVYNRTRLFFTQKSIAFYCMILVGVFYTFGRFEFAQDSYVLGVIYLCTILYKKKSPLTL